MFNVLNDKKKTDIKKSLRKFYLKIKYFSSVKLSLNLKLIATKNVLVLIYSFKPQIYTEKSPNECNLWKTQNQHF